MTTSSPVRIVGCDEPGPSDPVRIVNWDDIAQLDDFVITNERYTDLSSNIVDDEITLTKTEATVGGVRQVTLGYSAHKANINDEWHDVAAGTILLNSGHVINPTIYYVYSHIVGGACVVSASTIDPETDPLLSYKYAWVAIVRLKSVANVATIYYWRTAYTPNKLFLHYIGEYDYYTRPTWIQGGGITINATTGVVDMADLEYRRMRFDREEDAITAGTIILDDEATAVANLELITTYSDGSAITGGKYHKMLFGVIVGANKTNPFFVVRQGKPAVEYATLAAATIDAENVAANSFPFTYRGGVFHLAYIIMLKGDASDLTTIDIRPTGAGGSGGGGGTPITDHDALVNLGTTSHDKYLLLDGSRALTGDMAVDAGHTIDGVDISAHAANVNAHHAQSHVIATTAGLGADHTTSGLTAGQVLRATAATTAAFASLQAADIPALAYLPTAGGNLTGNVTADALVTIDGVDVSVHAATANAHHNAVTLNAAADTVLGLSTQQVTLDTQTANTVWAGPATGAAATPIFRALVAADFPTTGELGVILANGANNNVNIGTATLIRVTGPTANFNITGLTGGYAGRVLFIYNTTANNMTMTNESASSTAANRILTLGGAATNNDGLIELIYSATDNRWLVVGVRT